MSGLTSSIFIGNIIFFSFSEMMNLGIKSLSIGIHHESAFLFIYLHLVDLLSIYNVLEFKGHH